MPHPGDDISAAEPTTDRMIVAVGCLSSVDVLANIFAFLGVKDIMCNRRVNKKWKEAARKTIVPLCDFCVSSVSTYNAMRVMARAIPNLQQISINSFGSTQKYVDGEDPDEEWAGAFSNWSNWTSHDIEIISNFRKLRILYISSIGLNGRYPAFFNFPLLQKLSINNCKYLKWDLEILSGLPVLKELDCYYNPRLTGNISSLRVLKDTLEKVQIDYCQHVEGNFMDLSDFPHLKKLYLEKTPAVTGDIRDIGENDFSLLEQLVLPKTLYGGWGYELQRISDGHDLIRTLYLIKKQHPTLQSWTRHWKISADSPDWYETAGGDYDIVSEDSPDWYETAEDNYDIPPFVPPFYICFVQAGPRIGYRWTTNWWRPDDGKHCEVNWLDPQPESGSSDYARYIEELQEINSQVKRFYRGLHQPPTEEEYNRRWEEYKKRRDNKLLYRSSSGMILRIVYR
jgi:hypothetical protein